jgi:hypothetical protein
VGPRASLDGCRKSRLRRGMVPDHLACSELLYQLRYPGPTVHVLLAFEKSLVTIPCLLFIIGLEYHPLPKYKKTACPQNIVV